MSDRIHVLAKAELQRSDWRLIRALERSIAGEEWCDWRDEIRRLVRENEGVEDLPPEPAFGVASTVPAAPPERIIERVEVPVEVIREVERIVEVVREVMVPAPPVEGVPVGNSLLEDDPDAVPAELEPFRHEGETPDEFRKRMNWILFRFGMSEGDYTPDMPRLSNEEKIALYPLIEANARANDWLKFKT